MSGQESSWTRSATRTAHQDITALGRSKKIIAPAALAISALLLGSCEDTKTLGPFTHQGEPVARTKSDVSPEEQNTAAPEVANAPARVLTEKPETVLGSG